MQAESRLTLMERKFKNDLVATHLAGTKSRSQRKALKNAKRRGPKKGAPDSEDEESSSSSKLTEGVESESEGDETTSIKP